MILTGGLGPTQDDITRDALGVVVGTPMVRHPELEELLREKFRSFGRREMPESNLRQADVPEGVRYIEPSRGTAPGLVADLPSGVRVYAVPGVPEEMVEMMEGTILPELAARGTAVVRSKVLRCAGIGESALAERVDDLFTGSVNPTIAFLASSGEVKVRITAKAATAEEANALIEPVAEEVRRRIGDEVFTSEDESLEEAVVRLLSAARKTLACAESLTGGGVGGAHHVGPRVVRGVRRLGRRVPERGEGVRARGLASHARRSGAGERGVRPGDGGWGRGRSSTPPRAVAHGSGRPGTARRRAARGDLGGVGRRRRDARARLPCAGGAGPGPAMGGAGGARPRPSVPGGPAAPGVRSTDLRVRADGEEPRRAPGGQAAPAVRRARDPRGGQGPRRGGVRTVARGVPEGSLGPPREPARDAEVPRAGRGLASPSGCRSGSRRPSASSNPSTRGSSASGASRPRSAGARSGLGSTNPSRWGSSRARSTLRSADEFEPEKRAFHPHLTVARSDPPLKLPAAYTSTELESEPWSVDHVVLFRSHLGRPAPDGSCPLPSVGSTRAGALARSIAAAGCRREFGPLGPCRGLRVAFAFEHVFE